MMETTASDEGKGKDSGGSQKFGTFLGVYVPCILMLFGVIIFLRLGWIVGLVGVSESLIIITLAAGLALVTTLSMSSIATNTEVGKGGVYYMLSRSLGPEVGVALGIPLFFRQSLSIAFCCIGFAESLHDLIPTWGVTHIAMATLGLLTILAYTSVRGALKVQVGIFIAITASLVSLFTGTEVSPMPPETFTPVVPPALGFWVVFAIFFPAMTGMESSVSLSGDLKNPGRSLPIGTICALLTAYIIYVGISLFLSYRVPMDRLVADPLIMQDLATIPSLIIVGIWGATLSSALGGLLAAPRTLQAIAEDGMAPKIFAKTFGKTSEPRVATLATFLIALGGCLGSVNILAPLLTMISLICYCVLNLSAGMETLMANPNWRPRFRVHWVISLTGALACLITMLMIDSGAALLSLLLIVVLYFVVKTRDLDSTWTDIREGLLLFFSRSAIYRLAHAGGPSKSWRPHFLVFTDSQDAHFASIVKFAQGISRSRGFLTTASFVAPGTKTSTARRELANELSTYFKKEKIHALVQVKESETATSGMRDMIHHYGLGPLTPDTIIFGGIKKKDEGVEFIKMLRLAYKQHKNIVILTGVNQQVPTKCTNVHIWWDDTSSENVNLMLVLGYMAQLDQARRRSRLCVKAIAANEVGRRKKLEQLQQICLEKRMPVDIEVVVSLDGPEHQIELVQEFSKDADIVFLGLKPPPRDPAEIDDYMTYLQNLTTTNQTLPLAFVLSSKSMTLDGVLE